MAFHGLLSRSRRSNLSGRILHDAEDWAMRLVCRVLDMEPQEFGPSRSVGIVHGATLVAGVVYHDYRPQHGDCQMTVASISPRWAGREVLAYLFQYPFIELDCRRVSLTVRQDNDRCLRMVRRIGFVEEGRRRHFFGPGIDCIEFGWLRSEWEASPYRWDHG